MEKYQTYVWYIRRLLQGVSCQTCCRYSLQRGRGAKERAKIGDDDQPYELVGDENRQFNDMVGSTEKYGDYQ